MKLAKLTRYIFIFIVVISISIMLLMTSIITNEPRILTDFKSLSFDSQCIKNIEKTSQYLDDHGALSVSTWNIYKQKRQGWDKLLTSLNQASQLVLLQEVGLSPELRLNIQDFGGRVSMAKAFTLWNTSYGVMNLSRTEANSACAYTETEPFIRFAKSAIVAYYSLSNSEELLVVNLHGTNFEWDLTHYYHQFEPIALALSKHQGPIIFAGDFNTWRAKRLNFVTALTSRYNLSEINYRIDERKRVFGFPLDHIFYRGLTLIEANSLATDSSDHNPITARFMINLSH
ncbi:MAG: endonuclease/exonuclease/phosphatase family protein [Shewanella sp.]